MADYIGAISKLTADAAMGPPGLVVPLKPPMKFDQALQDALDRALAEVQTELTAARAAHPELPETLEPFGFAVADLSEGIAGFDKNTPAYAGRRDTKLLAVASLGKILPLYVAHLIRAAARDVVTATGVTTIDQLGPLLRNHLQRLGAADDTFPLIEDMLDLADGVVDFKTGGSRWPGAVGVIGDVDLNLIDENDDRTATISGKVRDSMAPAAKRTIVRGMLEDVAFREQLRLMARWSNDVSASVVIQAIGFPFLWRMANRSGLFRSGGWVELLDGPRKGTLVDPGGIFLGLDYSGNAWTSRPLQAPVQNKKPSQAGNARAVAQLMVSLAHELIDDEARISMREMLRKNTQFIAPNDQGERSPIGKGMVPEGYAPDQQAWGFADILGSGTVGGYALRNGDLAVSKVGLLRKQGLSVASNAVLVRCRPQLPAGAPIISAVLVGIGNWHGVDYDVLALLLNSFGKFMAVELVNRHL